MMNQSKATIENLNNELSTPNTAVLLYSDQKSHNFTVHDDIQTPQQIHEVEKISNNPILDQKANKVKAALNNRRSRMGRNPNQSKSMVNK